MKSCLGACFTKAFGYEGYVAMQRESRFYYNP